MHNRKGILSLDMLQLQKTGLSPTANYKDTVSITEFQFFLFL